MWDPFLVLKKTIFKLFFSLCVHIVLNGFSVPFSSYAHLPWKLHAELIACHNSLSAGPYVLSPIEQSTNPLALLSFLIYTTLS